MKQIGTVIKRTERKHVVEVFRRMDQGLEERALQLLASTQGGNVLNTSFIERINGTFRERLASLTRRCRHASHSVEMLAAGMWLVGCTYNFCWPHHAPEPTTQTEPDTCSGKWLDRSSPLACVSSLRIGWLHHHGNPPSAARAASAPLVVLLRLLRSSGRLACSA